MANEFRKVTDQNGVDHPVTDDTRVTWTANGVLGAKNRLAVKISTLKTLNTTGTWSDNAYTINGVTLTCTVDSNGYVTNIAGSNNSASANITFFLSDNISFSDAFILSGCPSGGSVSTYKLLLVNSGGSSLDLPEDYGNGATIQTNNSFRVQLRIYSGQSANNLNFKPMIRDSADTDPTYQPYAMTNRELTEKVIPNNFVKITDNSYANEILYARLGQTKYVQISAPKGISANTTTEIMEIPEGYKSDVAVASGTIAAFSHDFMISGGRIRLAITNSGKLTINSTVAISSAIDSILSIPYI